AGDHSLYDGCRRDPRPVVRLLGRKGGRMIYTVTLNPAVDRELTVPEFAFDTVLRATAWQVDYGGKGFNVSRMLRSLGASSVALAFTGGRSGELLGDGLAALEIETAFIWVEG